MSLSKGRQSGTAQYEKEISKEKKRYELRKTISSKVAKNLVVVYNLETIR